MSSTTNLLTDGGLNDHVFLDWQKHSGAERLDTVLALLTTLRRNYSGYTVTVASAATGLLEYANAGNAKAVPDRSEATFVALRQYLPASRLAGVEHGKITDEIRFGKHEYEWQSHKMIVYFAAWEEGAWMDIKERYFILFKDEKASKTNGTPKVVDELIAAASKWNLDLHDEVWVFDQEQWTKSKKLWHSVSKADWNDVILDPVVKISLIDDVEGFFDSEDEYREFAVSWRRGLILHGSPGNGKSLSIKALMRSLALRKSPIPTLYVKSFAGCHNETFAIRAVFEKARETSPCLLVFEDLDSLVKEKVRSFFLNEVDGLEDNDGLMIIGSTNYLEKLDPSITKRPSRFDRKYHFASPGLSERVRYCDYWRRKLLNNRKVEFPEELCSDIAEITHGFSFAYMKEAFVFALLSIVNSQRSKEVSGGEGDTNDAIPQQFDSDKAVEREDLLLWRTINKQVSSLRVEMEDAQKAAEEVDKKKGGAKGKKGMKQVAHQKDEQSKDDVDEKEPEKESGGQ